LKKNILEKAYKAHDAELVIKTNPLTTRSKSKGKTENEDVQELETSQQRIHVTRSSARKLELQKETLMKGKC